MRALLGRFGILILGLIGLAVYWVSNQQEVPFTGRSQFNILSIPDATRLGAQGYAQILEQNRGNLLCAGAGTVCDAQTREVVDSVRRIGARLEAAAIELEADLLEQGYAFTPVAERFDWTYHVIDSPQPNAFCLPGGYVAVYTGLLDVTGNFDGVVSIRDLDDLDKLAVVMGHEIGHALAHHGAERMSQQKLVQMGQMAVGLGLGDLSMGERQAVMGALGVAATGGLNAFSRAHETEADRIGLELLARACFDPREAPELWRRMATLGGGSEPPPWLSTHPASETRAENFERWMPAALALYETGCQPNAP